MLPTRHCRICSWFQSFTSLGCAHGEVHVLDLHPQPMCHGGGKWMEFWPVGVSLLLTSAAPAQGARQDVSTDSRCRLLTFVSPSSHKAWTLPNRTPRRCTEGPTSVPFRSYELWDSHSLHEMASGDPNYWAVPCVLRHRWFSGYSIVLSVSTGSVVMSPLVTDRGDSLPLSLKTSGKKIIGCTDIYKDPDLGSLISSVIVMFLMSLILYLFLFPLGLICSFFLVFFFRV